jgi:hypothetical protein
MARKRLSSPLAYRSQAVAFFSLFLAPDINRPVYYTRERQHSLAAMDRRCAHHLPASFGLIKLLQKKAAMAAMACTRVT